MIPKLHLYVLITATSLSTFLSINEAWKAGQRLQNEDAWKIEVVL